jgi:hypothetical protein
MSENASGSANKGETKITPQLFVPLRDQIERLVKQALENFKTDQSRAFVFAHYHVNARLWRQGEDVSEQHAWRAIHECVGELYGNLKGYEDPELAKLLNQKGREARQQVHSSARAAHRQLATLCRVYEQNFQGLPSHIQSTFPIAKLLECRDQILSLQRWADPGRNPLLAARKRKLSRGPTVPVLTYLWWRYLVEPPATWEEMHSFAIAWRISDAEDVESFRRLVLKQTANFRQQERIPFCPPPQGE